MGCAASKLDNEDAVRRCKERRHLMKEAVKSRHHVAAAHSDYLSSLRRTASALSQFAQGQPFDVADGAPAVLLRRQTSSSIPRHRPETPPHPPPPPNFSPSPSPTIASSKLPHILSESSPSLHVRTFQDRCYARSNSTSVSTHRQIHSHSHAFPPLGKSPPADSYFRSNSTFTSTPSQASSAWNWENFFPPSPPASDFFRRRDCHPADSDDGATAREEVQCSDWGDHDHDHDQFTTSSSDTRSEEDAEIESRSEATRSNLGLESELSTHHARLSTSDSQKLGRVKIPAGGSSSPTQTVELKMVVRHRNLAEIIVAVEEYFVTAAAAGEAVSNLLETSPTHFNRGFQRLKKRVYHSSGVLSTLSSSWTSKPPLAVRYELDTRALEVSGDTKSHWATLERLLAWEKKLYEEVKERERVKIEHEKKLASLQSQEYRGREQAKLDKTKASIKKLQSDILVTTQAVSTTSAAIIRIRDNELAPQLVEICYEITKMWKSMNQCHEVQSHIVGQVRGLINQWAGGESSEGQRAATQNLESAVSGWHSSFCRLLKYQRNYIRSIHGWLKLTLHHVDEVRAAGESAAMTQVASDLFAFCDEWKQCLDRAPDTVASEAINSLVRVVHAIAEKQAEEVKIKKRIEVVSKELEKKAGNLRNIERKFYQSYSMVGVGPPDTGLGNGQVFDSMDPLAEKKAELAECRRKLEEEMGRHAKAVEVTRAMTLNNMQTGLPGVFQALTAFSAVFAESLDGVCLRADPPSRIDAHTD